MEAPVKDGFEPHDTGEERGLYPLPVSDGVEGFDEDMVPRLEALAILDRQLEALLPWVGKALRTTGGPSPKKQTSFFPCLNCLYCF